MKRPLWVGADLALVVHDLQLLEHGGAAGVRDRKLLESALARPKNIFANSSRRPSLGRLAASYAHGIISNHPFIDGNKRTALVVAVTFLQLKGCDLNASEEDVYLTFSRLAAGHISEPRLAAWFQRHIVELE
jgi:death-on-curing protein